MHAAVLHALGESPRYEEFAEPIAGEGEAIIQVRAAALKPVDRQMASGSHYASFREFPVVCGLDGVGVLDDGARVFFAGPRRPFGAMAERTVTRRALCWPVPENVDDITAAAIVNPGMSAWLTLAISAQIAPGETVLILGATGTTGKLAVQIAKLLGAGRVVAAGRNQEALDSLHSWGADATIRLQGPGEVLTESFAREASVAAYDVIVDYLWGWPTEALLAALARSDLKPAQSSRTRLVQVGESAGSTIMLPAATLRSSGLQIVGAGTGTIPPMEVLQDTYHQLMARAASGELRIDTDSVPLADVEKAWAREGRARLVLIPNR
jgi:NADPH:quinone reductase-like Zn-dependent oxidoreductase